MRFLSLYSRPLHLYSDLIDRFASTPSLHRSDSPFEQLNSLSILTVNHSPQLNHQLNNLYILTLISLPTELPWCLSLLRWAHAMAVNTCSEKEAAERREGGPTEGVGVRSQ